MAVPGGGPLSRERKRRDRARRPRSLPQPPTFRHRGSRQMTRSRHCTRHAPAPAPSRARPPRDNPSMAHTRERAPGGQQQGPGRDGSGAWAGRLRGGARVTSTARRKSCQTSVPLGRRADAAFVSSLAQHVVKTRGHKARIARERFVDLWQERLEHPRLGPLLVRLLRPSGPMTRSPAGATGSVGDHWAHVRQTSTRRQLSV
jgi:hypothetical protein